MISDLRSNEVATEKRHKIEMIAYIKTCDSLAAVKADQERERERIQAKERLEENNRIMDAALHKMDHLIKGQEISKKQAKRTLSTIKKP